MKNSDIISRLETLSLYFTSFEQELKDMRSELIKITIELESIKECIGDELWTKK
jgi:hypothetical protein